MTTVSLAAYARHRGVSEARISALKRQGRLTLNGNGVDLELTDAALNASLATYRGGERGGSRSKAAKEQDAAARPADGNGKHPPPSVPPQGMAASVAMKEFYLSKLREVEYDEKLGVLVEIEAVVEEVAAVFATVRNLLLGLPAKIAPRIIHCRDAEAARALLLDEIQGVLRELSSEPDDEGD